MRTNAHKVIPKFYGYFFHRYTKVAILSDEGSTLEEFHELSGDMRLNIFKALLEIHRAHVAIKDFNPNNVIISKQGAIICGFTQAIIDHICPGTTECPELAEAQNMLLLDNGSSLLDIGNKSITRKT
ncbi:hypothetical protein CPB86DRAFT_786305 [Serendipita vermifera]|nr:hypothetical protein CPB86DRAFT_786305 [Serendipita vermifera]